MIDEFDDVIRELGADKPAEPPGWAEAKAAADGHFAYAARDELASETTTFQAPQEPRQCVLAEYRELIDLMEFARRIAALPSSYEARRPDRISVHVLDLLIGEARRLVGSGQT